MNIETILDRLQGVKKNGDGYTARCPAHEDKSPSLSIRLADDGKILLKCHAGCDAAAIVNAVGLSLADLFPGRKEKLQPAKAPAGKIVAEYDYRDEGGKRLFQVVRLDPKSFRQRRPDPAALDGWAWTTKGVKRVLYRLPELLEAIKRQDPIYVAEGEKDVECLVKHGFAATCNVGGAGKWEKSYSESFQGAGLVIVIADKDKPDPKTGACPGKAHANAVALQLREQARVVKVIELPDLEGKPVKDAADFFAVGGTADALRALAEKAPEYVPQEEMTPLHWFKKRFPGLDAKHGEPVQMQPKTPLPAAKDICPDFMAAAFGPEGSPNAPTIHESNEGWFYHYRSEGPAVGIFKRQREEELAMRYSALFLECARDCRQAADVAKLEFDLRKQAGTAGVIQSAKGILSVPGFFDQTDIPEFIPVANGVLRLSDRALLPFSPSYRFRAKLAVAYDPKAQCPLFKEKLLGDALDEYDQLLVLRYGGMLLMGRNVAQTILLLTGTAGGGKGTLVNVIGGIIGTENMVELRTTQLEKQFETSRFVGKSLLYGADVPGDFLSGESASRLKALTGGDWMSAEFKFANGSYGIKGTFNVLITSNSRLTVHLEGDADAWRRRLLIIKYQRPKPAKPIHDLAERIIKEEGSGVLNHFLDGYDDLKAAGWKFRLTPSQQTKIDDLLLESEAHTVFASDCLQKDPSATGMTITEAYNHFVEFCTGRGWEAVTRNHFGKVIRDAVTQIHGLAVRNDIRGPDGKADRGWRGLRLKNQPADFQRNSQPGIFPE